jgi:hypothetical protein
VYVSSVPDTFLRTLDLMEPVGRGIIFLKVVFHSSERRAMSSPSMFCSQCGAPITPTARFSLLFDCSTSPQSFSPCDFSADSPANLPAELRVNQAGQAGYLNISGPDNWAGHRSGFAPQRHPADPVLRIVLGD